MENVTPECRGENLSLPVFRKRSGVVLSFLLTWAVLAAVHVFYYARMTREKLLAESFRIASREGNLPAPRGRILSADGHVLAWTEIHYDLVFEKTSSELSANMEKELRRTFPDFVMPDLQSENERGILLKTSLDPGGILACKELLGKYPGLEITPVFERKRIPGTVLRTFLGEIQDGHGVSGVERKYDSELGGTPGRFRVMFDRRNSWIGGTVRILREPVPGMDVFLEKSYPEILESEKTAVSE